MKQQIQHADLFAGIGGFSLAAKWMNWYTAFWVEKNKYCQQILKKNFPNSIGYEDITETNFNKWNGEIDILTGGFPCQPFSLAGKRKGAADKRDLWHEMFRCVRETKPTIVIGENVFGIISMENGDTLERIYTDLESEGYEVQSFIIPACAVEAWHQRNRIWIIAYSDKASAKNKVQARWNVANGLSKQRLSDTDPFKNELQGVNTQNSVKEQFSKREHTRLCISDARRWLKHSLSTPAFLRKSDGISNRVDRTQALGNAIVPQVAFELFKGIEKVYFND